MQKQKIIIDVIIAILIVAFIVSSIISFNGFKEYGSVKNYSSKLSKEVKKEEKPNRDKQVDFNRLWKINSDIVAWIEIPGTPIDYPIVAGDDNEFYLSHNVEKQSNSYGSIFVDYRVKDVVLQCKNTIIFGHNMGRYTDVMFSSLMKYEKENYYKENKEVIIYLPGQKFVYEVASVREVNDNSYAYNISFSDEKSYNEWLVKSIEDSLYKIESENLDNVENVVTLSTCTYGANKLVVLCVPQEKM